MGWTGRKKGKKDGQKGVLLILVTFLKPVTFFATLFRYTNEIGVGKIAWTAPNTIIDFPRSIIAILGFRSQILQSEQFFRFCQRFLEASFGPGVDELKAVSSNLLALSFHS